MIRISELDDRIVVTGDAADLEAFQQLVQQARQQALYQAEPDLETLRNGFRSFAASTLARKPPHNTAIEPVNVDGMPGLWVRAARAHSRFSTLYLHGGGYVCGSARAEAGVAASFSQALGCPVLAIDYRQAPEHPFPAAIEDVLKACRWLSASTRTPFIICGDSAGGGLAVAASVMLAETGPVRADGVITVSGALDLTMSAESWRRDQADLISAAQAPFLYGLYLQGADARDPRASPVFADLRHLPPTLIIAGGAEYMLGDSQLLARAARAQGRTVRFEVYEAMPHNFVKFSSPIADFAFARIGEWLQAQLPELLDGNDEPNHSRPAPR